MIENRPDLKHKFDIIMMSETLYNIQYYDSLVACIDYCLKDSPDALVVIGTKTFYFGLGGGHYEFE